MEKPRIIQRVAQMVAGLLLLTLVGCDSQSGSGGGSGGVIIEPTAAVTTAALRPGQTATLDILGVQTGIPMTVNPDGSVTATVGNIPVGTYSFRITYRLPSVLSDPKSQVVTVAEASGTGNVLAGVTNTVSFTTLNTNFDDDGDSVLNLDEINGDTDPLDPLSRPTKPLAIAAGRSRLFSASTVTQSHTCARLFNGTIRCWGFNGHGELGDGTTTNAPIPVLVTGITTKATDIAAGESHSCAVLSNHTVQCWGLNDNGQLGDGTTTSSLTPVSVTGITTAMTVAAGQSHSCAQLLNGTVQCWGTNGSGQLGNGTTTSSSTPVLVSGITTATAVVAGDNHSCAVLPTGTLPGNVQCWGLNDNGQLGNGTTTSSSTPVLVSGITTATVVAAGGNHSCAVFPIGTLPGNVRCWGANFFGQLGDNTTTVTSIPVVAKDITTATDVAAGVNHSCAVLSNGTVQCWGFNGSGQLGNGTTTSSSTPVLVSGITTATAVAAGGLHSCSILSTGAVRCWGDRGPGHLGDGVQTNSSSPGTKVNRVATATVVAAGGGHSCAALSNGTVQCWGSNDNGQLGDNTTTDTSIPVVVKNITTATVVAAGEDHSCAVLPTGTLPGNVQCWGFNNFGQLGNGTQITSSSPVSVTGITTAKTVATGENHSCAVLPTGTLPGNVQCWGSNGSGQLGDGTQITSSSPVSVTGITTAETVATGANHSCAALVNGTVQCWGSNDSGQLGIPRTTLSSSTPVPVTGITTAKAVTAGLFHSCALLSTGDVQCWGDNRNGQLGNGTQIALSSTPVLALGITTATSVSVGRGHSCAALLNGTVQCWGANDSGQLGNGATTNTSFPVLADGLTKATAVSVGGVHSCARLSTEEIQCWGENVSGQLGNGLIIQSPLPVPVLGIP